MDMNKNFFLKMTILASAALFSLSVYAQDVADRCTRHTLKSGGLEREFWLYRPAGLPDGAPLVVALHGYGGSALKGKNGLMDKADAEGFAVCYPQGSTDSRGKSFWKVGYPFNEADKVDDVAFLRKLVRHLQREFGFSRENTFMTGMSNGGEMCYLMAQKAPDTFTAYASVAGLTIASMDMVYRKPVPFMEIHGTADHTSEWNGDPVDKGGWGAYLAVPVSVSYIVAADGCRYAEEETLPVRRNVVTRYRFLGGEPAWKGGPECEVRLYKVDGGKHTWAEADMDTFGEIWDFFSQYLRR